MFFVVILGNCITRYVAHSISLAILIHLSHHLFFLAAASNLAVYVCIKRTLNLCTCKITVFLCKLSTLVLKLYCLPLRLFVLFYSFYFCDIHVFIIFILVSLCCAFG